MDHVCRSSRLREAHGGPGADVTKIETPDGDYRRTYGSKMDVPGEDGENPPFDLTNANKKAVTLNLRTPGGKVSVSLYGGAVWTMCVMVTAAQKKYGCKYPRERELCKPSAATYKYKDGEYISIAAAQYERDFPKLCAVLGIPEVAELPEYRLAPLLGEHSEQVLTELGYTQEQIAQFEQDGAIFAVK